MNMFDLGQALARARDGESIQVPAGEYFGTWRIERPVRIIGAGSVSVLWAKRGPVIEILAPNVHLEGLALEVTEDQESVAILLGGEAERRPPSFARLRVQGSVEGKGAARRWRIPPVIEFGQVVRGNVIRRTLGLDVLGALQARPELAGLRVQVQDERSGQAALQLELSSNELTPGTLLDGRLELESGGLISLIRLTGWVVAANQAPRGTILDPLRETVPTRPATPGKAAFDILQQERDASGMPGPPPSLSPKPPSQPVAPAPPKTETAAPSEQQLSLVETLVEDANQAMQQDNLERAIDLLNQALRLKPEAAPVAAHLASLYAKQGNFDAAAHEWEKVIAKDPNYPNGYRELAVCYNQLGRYAGAIRLMESALRMPQNKQNAEFMRALAMSYSKAGRLDEAIWALDQAQKIQFEPKLAALRKAWEQKLARQV
jgi:Tfp pilus assembly protein PilF